MNRIAVLVVRDSSPIQFAGLDLADRAARVARRAGAETVQMVDDDQPFASAPPAELLLVLPERVVVEPGLLADLMRRSLVGLEDAAVVVRCRRKVDRHSAAVARGGEADPLRSTSAFGLAAARR